jgi:hypothetical protein
LTNLIVLSSLGLAAWAFAAQPVLGGAIAGKSGPPNARVWSFQVGNNGPGDAVNAQITGISFARTNGPACSPVIQSPLPLNAGTIAPQGLAGVSVTIDFSSCDAGALFKVTVAESANSGAATGTIVRLNQFQ